MKQYIKIYILISWVMLSMISCVTNKDTTMLQEGVKIPQYEKVDFEHYKLSINDQLSFLFFSPNKSDVTTFTGIHMGSTTILNNVTVFRIHPDGNVILPYIREVHVVGLTLREAQEKINNELKSTFPDAQLKISLANSYYYVLGDNHRGQYSCYKDKISIYEALAQSGEVSKLGDKRNIRIVRQTPQGEVVKVFDLRSRSVVDSEFYYIQPNDVIYIQQSKGAFFRITSLSSFIALISTSIALLASVLTLIK